MTVRWTWPIYGKVKFGALPSFFKWWPCVDLDLFYGKVKFIPYAFVLEKGKIMDFPETVVVYDIRVGRFSQLNKYMKLYEYQRSRCIHWPSSKVTQIQHFRTCFAQKPLGRLKPNFIWSLHGMCGMKICSNVPGHITMPIYGEKLKNLLLRIQKADNLETWYTTSGTWVLPMCSYDHPGMTLTIFMTGSNLFLNASAWMKAYTALSANVFPSLF